MNTAIAIAPEQEVRANINEQAFFKVMAKMFDTSFTVLSELMQNSRRAGADFVSFTFDPANKNLTITDNGCGIDDFGVLVSLCESGWDEQTVLTDRPFGMGFFSVFFACQVVTIRSNGLRMVVAQDDILNKRAMRAVKDDQPITAGTVLELSGLSEDLMRTETFFGKGVVEFDSYCLAKKIKSFARGFGIRVLLNDRELPRPHALTNLTVQTTHLGDIHIAHMHDDREPYCLEWSTAHTADSFKALYLQGLPIHIDNAEHARLVVHLDSQVFQPKIPDRTRLFNGDDQLKSLYKHVRSMIVDYLCEQKRLMDPVRFVSMYWEMCKQFGQMHLFNDVPFFPADMLVGIGDLDGESCYEHLYDEKKLVTRQDILDRKFVVWRDEPDDVVDGDGVYDGVILKVMQRLKIHALRSGLNEGHWINQLTPSCLDFLVELDAPDPVAQGEDYVGSHNVAIKLVDSVKVVITSAVDPSFMVEETVVDDWLLVAAPGDDPSDWESAFVCFVNQRSRASDHPVPCLANFTDEYDQFRQEWQDEAVSGWNGIVRSLRGGTLAAALASIGGDMNLPRDRHIGQLALVTCQQEWRQHTSSYGDGQVAAFDLEKPDVWEKYAALLREQWINNPGSSGATLRDLFVQATGAQAQVGKPQDNASADA